MTMHHYDIGKTEEELDAMPTDQLDRYHDSLLTCIEILDGVSAGSVDAQFLESYRIQEKRVAQRLRARGWPT